VNPYLTQGDTIISFSGGRTSGFMLRQIIDAHGGTLPETVRVVFCNTGLEHPATYEFVRDVQDRWAVPIQWLEYDRVGGKAIARLVDFNTASRKGEPFTKLIEYRKMLPTPLARFCTSELKIRTTARFVESLGWVEYDNAVGLRADEPKRVAKMKGDRKAENVVLPMAKAGHTLADVLTFWKEQPFDLGLPDNGYGNCVGCFLKARHKIERIADENPEMLEWWADTETRVGATFRIDRPSYSSTLVQVRIQGKLFQGEEDDTIPCMCTD